MRQADRRQLLRDCLALGMAWMQYVGGIAQRSGLPLSDLLVLVALQDQEGRTRPSTLDVALPLSSLSDSLRRLEDRGLVGRERDEEDRRALWVVLTPEGRAEADTMMIQAERLFEGLGRGDLADLRRLLDLLLPLAQGKDPGSTGVP